MPQRGIYIYRLDLKLDIIGQVLVDAGKVDEPRLANLADFLKVPYPTLKSARTTRRLSHDLLDRLKKCRVFSTDQNWNDTSVKEAVKRAAETARGAGGLNYPGKDTELAREI